MSKKEAPKPRHRPNVGYTDLFLVRHSYLQHRTLHCRGTILLPVSLRNLEQATGRPYCAKCGAKVGRKALRTIWKGVNGGLYRTSPVPVYGGRIALGFLDTGLSNPEPETIRNHHVIQPTGEPTGRKPRRRSSFWALPTTFAPLENPRSSEPKPASKAYKYKPRKGTGLWRKTQREALWKALWDRHPRRGGDL